MSKEESKVAGVALEALRQPLPLESLLLAALLESWANVLDNEYERIAGLIPRQKEKGYVPKDRTIIPGVYAMLNPHEERPELYNEIEIETPVDSMHGLRDVIRVMRDLVEQLRGA